MQILQVKTGLGLADMLRRVERPIFGEGLSHRKPDCKREGNIDGPLYGEVLVFTGALHIPREQACDIAAKLGCRVAANVSKATTLVGDHDIAQLAGHANSSKRRTAEELITKGVPIRTPLWKEASTKANRRLIGYSDDASKARKPGTGQVSETRLDRDRPEQGSLSQSSIDP